MNCAMFVQLKQHSHSIFLSTINARQRKPQAVASAK